MKKLNGIAYKTLADLLKDNNDDRKMADEFKFIAEKFQKMNSYKSISDIDYDFKPETTIKLKESASKELKKAWDLAIYEFEKSIIDSPYGGRYSTGASRGFGGWHQMIFGYCGSDSGLLGFNKIYPDLQRSILRTYCLARVNTGFMGPKGWLIEGIDNAVPCPDTHAPGSEFVRRYRISPPINKTGTMDIGWLWSAADLFEMHGNKSDWAWLYSMGDLFFNYFYKPFFDEKDGLYWGDPSYDVGISDCFPEDFGYFTQSARNKGIWVKATGTNCLYLKGMDAMAYAADILNMPEKSINWKNRAVELKKAIKSQLRFDNGKFTYFKYPDGRLEERQSTFGSAIAVLSEVVTGQEAIDVLEDYPVSEIGSISLYPPYEEQDVDHNEEGYADFPEQGVHHNLNAESHKSTYMILALEKATGKKFYKEHAEILANLIVVHNEDKGGILMFPDTGDGVIKGIDTSTGTFCEYIKWKEKKDPSKNTGITHTIAAFINLCLRAGYTEQDFTKESSFFNTRKV